MEWAGLKEGAGLKGWVVEWAGLKQRRAAYGHGRGLRKGAGLIGGVANGVGGASRGRGLNGGQSGPTADVTACIPPPTQG